MIHMQGSLMLRLPDVEKAAHHFGQAHLHKAENSRYASVNMQYLSRYRQATSSLISNASKFARML